MNGTLLSESAAAQKLIAAMGEASFQNERNLNQQIRSAKPMAIVAGPVGPPLNGIARTVIGEDPELLKKSAPFRLKNETTVLAFIGRTGISAHQLRTYSKSELENLYRVVMSNEDTVVVPHTTGIPDKFRITFTSGGNIDAVTSKMPPGIADTWHAQ